MGRTLARLVSLWPLVATRILTIKGDVITGLDTAETVDRKVFQAGTDSDEGNTVTNGGRVLCVSALGNSVAEAQENAYEGVNLISWNNAYFRTDIGYRAIRREQ